MLAETIAVGERGKAAAMLRNDLEQVCLVGARRLAGRLTVRAVPTASRRSLFAAGGGAEGGPGWRQGAAGGAGAPLRHEGGQRQRGRCAAGALWKEVSDSRHRWEAGIAVSGQLTAQHASSRAAPEPARIRCSDQMLGATRRGPQLDGDLGCLGVSFVIDAGNLLAIIS